MHRQSLSKAQTSRSRGNHLQRKSARSATHPLLELQRSIGNRAFRRLTDSVQILRQKDTGGAPLGNQPSSQPIDVHCNPALFDISQIDRAVDTAKMWMGTAIPLLDLFRMRQLSTDRETAVRVALRANFNITDPFPRFPRLFNPVDTILKNFIRIEQGLNQPLQFFCGGSVCRPGELAFVFPNPAKLKLPPGIINICPGFFGCNPLKQASTMIHERAHEVLGAQDHAYEVSGKFDVLSPDTALGNADSYAVLARQLYHDGLHGPGIACGGFRIPDLQLSPPPLEMPRRPRPTLTPQP